MRTGAGGNWRKASCSFSNSAMRCGSTDAPRALFRGRRDQLRLARAKQCADQGIELAGSVVQLQSRCQRVDLIAQRVEPFLAAVAQEPISPRLRVGAAPERARVGRMFSSNARAVDMQ